MFKTIAKPPSRRPAGAAGPQKAERLLLALVTAGILLALALAVLLLRFQRLSELPPGLAFDEGVHGELALQVLQGEHAVFFPEDYGRQAWAPYVLALSTYLTGRTLLAMHLPSALGSAGIVFVVFWLGRILYGKDESGRATPWRGLLISGVGAGLLAVSIGQTVAGRSSYNESIYMSLLLALCLGLLWQGRRKRSWWRVVLAGVCAGLLSYTYIPAYFTPFLFLSFGTSFFLPLGSLTMERVRAELPWIGLFLGVAVLVAAPNFVHYALHPEHLFSHSSRLSIFNPIHSQGDPLGAFVRNLWDYVLNFGVQGSSNLHYNVPGQPMLNKWETFFFGIGLGIAMWRWQRWPAYRLLILWLGIMILPAVLSKDPDGWGPNPMRMMGAVPAIYLLIGVGTHEAIQFLKESCRALPQRLNQIFQKNQTSFAIIVGAVISGAIACHGVKTYRTYFHEWAAQPELYKAYEVPWIDLTQVLNSLPSDGSMTYLVPNSQHRYSFRYLYQGASPAYLYHPATPNLAQEIESMLTTMENVSTVKVVEWQGKAAWIGKDPGRSALLLSKYGRYQGGEDFQTFRIHSYSDIFLDRPWTFYDQLEPLTVDYDGGIALQGLALGQGAEQMLSRQLIRLERDRSLWMALRWQTAPGLDVDYAISLRLYNAEGEKAFQEDVVLWNPRHWPTSRWSGDVPVDTLYLLNFPADLPASEYALRLVVYNGETLVPTVEIGVWEPEVIVARLRLADAQ